MSGALALAVSGREAIRAGKLAVAWANAQARRGRVVAGWTPVPAGVLAVHGLRPLGAASARRAATGLAAPAVPPHTQRLAVVATAATATQTNLP